MHVKLLSDAFDALERAHDSTALLAETQKFAHSMGFEQFAYVLSIKAPSYKPQQYILNGYPSAWVDRYLSRDFFKIDPIVRHAQASTLPTMWDEQMFRDGKAQEFWEEAKAFGMHTGLSFAVHDQPAVTGIFSLARDQKLELSAHDLAALIGRAQLFASLLHHAVCRIDLPKLLPEVNACLTARERECLQWTAEGKTAWEVGQILSISERTAVFHLNNAIQKMGASNKAQAIVRAVALRLV